MSGFPLSCRTITIAFREEARMNKQIVSSSLSQVEQHVLSDGLLYPTFIEDASATRRPCSKSAHRYVLRAKNILAYIRRETPASLVIRICFCMVCKKFNSNTAFSRVSIKSLMKAINKVGPTPLPWTLVRWTDSDWAEFIYSCLASTGRWKKFRSHARRLSRMS